MEIFFRKFRMRPMAVSTTPWHVHMISTKSSCHFGVRLVRHLFALALLISSGVRTEKYHIIKRRPEHGIWHCACDKTAECVWKFCNASPHRLNHCAIFLRRSSEGRQTCSSRSSERCLILDSLKKGNASTNQEIALTTFRAVRFALHHGSGKNVIIPVYHLLCEW